MKNIISKKLALVLLVLVSYMSMNMNLINSLRSYPQHPQQQGKPDQHPTHPKYGCEGDLVGTTDQGCYEFSNCLVYSVNENLFNYGCTQCEKEYTLKSTDLYSGTCVKESNPAHCLWKITDNKVQVCKLCEDGLVLSNSRKYCYESKHYHKVDKCQSYVRIGHDIRCNACEFGYTLDRIHNRCYETCDIFNCDRCELTEGTGKGKNDREKLCAKCACGTIGIFEQSTGLYDKCMTCKTWQCISLTPQVQDCCLNKKENGGKNGQNGSGNGQNGSGNGQNGSGQNGQQQGGHGGDGKQYPPQIQKGYPEHHYKDDKDNGQHQGQDGHHGGNNYPDHDNKDDKDNGQNQGGQDGQNQGGQDGDNGYIVGGTSQNDRTQMIDDGSNGDGSGQDQGQGQGQGQGGDSGEKPDDMGWM